MSIKFVRPVISNKSGDNSEEGFIASKIADAKQMNPWEDDGVNTVDAGLIENYRKALYENTEARYTSDLYNVTNGAGAEKPFVFTAGTTQVPLVGGAFGENGENFRKGYTVVYGVNADGTGDETTVIAIESKRSGAFKVSPNSNVTVAYGEVDGKPVLNITGATEDFAVFARADLEGDKSGKGIPEVELVMSDITFQPRESSIGVSWTNLSEIVMDASFNLSSKDMMLRAAADAISANLDYRAFKLAYATAKANPAQWHVTFKAADANATQVDGLYTYTAQTITTAIETMADTMHSALNRGGVSKIVAGCSAGTYLTLSKDFDFTGKEASEGVFRYGQIAKIPVFKAPSSIISPQDLLCVKLVA